MAGAAVSICNGTVAGIGFGVGIVFTGAAVSICTGTEAGIKSVVGFRLGATLRSQSLMGWVVGLWFGLEVDVSEPSLGSGGCEVVVMGTSSFGA